MAVVLEAEPESVRETGGWRLWGSAPSLTVASRCAALFCVPPRTSPRFQIEARTIPGALRGDERVRVVGEISEYTPGGWFIPDGTLKLIDA